MIFQRPDRRRRDVSNYAKACEDCLVKSGLVEDDSLCQKLVLMWSGDEPVKPACALITIEGLP